VEFGYELSQNISEGTEYDGRGRIGQDDLDRLQQHDVYPFNNFTKEEKLNIALKMAEGVAILHGNAEGVIMNDDVHPDQWLVNKDGLIKLNDMNNAHIMEWNPTANDYCKYHVWIGGDYRSPEELSAVPVDEKSDVWPLGAMIFGILSGLFPYYHEWSRWNIEPMIAQGVRPYLDPRYRNRSLIEGRLYDIMQACFEVNPEHRPSSFEVVRHLRETQLLVEQAKLSGAWIPERDDPRPQQESLLNVRARFDRERAEREASKEKTETTSKSESESKSLTGEE